MRTLAMLAVLLIPSVAVAQSIGPHANASEAVWRKWMAQHPYLEVVRIESADTVLCQSYGISDFRYYRQGPYVRVTGIPAEGLRWRVTGKPVDQPGGSPLWGPGTILDVRNPSHVTIGAIPTLRY